MENWRNVPGFNGLYQIDISTKEGRCRRIGKRGFIEIKGSISSSGYKFWTIGGRKGKHQQAARWIAITFPELVQNDYFDGAVIDHVDTDRLNNHPSNLRWVTVRDNVNNPLTKQHMSDAGKIKYFSKEHRNNLSKSHKGKMKNNIQASKPVQQFTRDGKLVEEYPSAAEASRLTGIKYNSICDVCRGRSYRGRHFKTAGGYIWKYAEREAIY